jgi:hypothetical protein
LFMNQGGAYGDLEIMWMKRATGMESEVTCIIHRP